MTQIKFTKTFLMDELGLPYDNDDIIIKDKIIDTSRWSEIHELIFKHDGKFYSTSYSQGLTEQQCEQAWEFDNEIKCQEVFPVEKTVTVYIPKQ